MQTDKTLPAKYTFAPGKWMPQDQITLTAWMKKIMSKADDCSAKPLLPVVQRFKDFIENDPKAFMFFTRMFEEVPGKKKKTSNGLPQVRDYHHMLQLFNVILTHAPEFNDTGFVGFPFNAILDWSMATPDGWAGFLDEKVNFHLKEILDDWGKFLRSPDSCYVLNADPRSGWFGEDAAKAMPDFAKEFVCYPDMPHYGFKSWDDFFVRRFRSGVRPVASPEDDNVITNPCESAPFALKQNVQLFDRFWIKTQPYAVKFMLNNDPLCRHFENGTVYQAFLSALSYHRWHSPISGTVVKAMNVPGTYYSEARSMGYDPFGPNDSQGYISELAARAVIFIEADNPDIGLVAFVAIGMAEVSSCEITVYEGQHISKGQETGMFHFGGSTFCLLFRPGLKLSFDLRGQTPGLETHNIKLNEKLATVMQ